MADQLPKSRVEPVNANLTEVHSQATLPHPSAFHNPLRLIGRRHAWGRMGRGIVQADDRRERSRDLPQGWNRHGQHPMMKQKSCASPS